MRLLNVISKSLKEQIRKHNDGVILEHAKETDSPGTSVVLQLGDYEKTVFYVPGNAPDSLEALVHDAERWATRL